MQLLQDIGWHMVWTWVEMAPFLLLGFAFAGVLSVLISPAKVERHLGRRGLGSVIKAALLGVPMPLCSCGVIPVTASLRLHGASRGASVSFLISTPQTGVDSIFVTWSLLGPVFAVFRPLAALFSGILGGTVTNWLDRGEAAGPVPGTVKAAPEPVSPLPRWRRALHYGFVVLPRDLAKPLLLGLCVAGVISALVPDNFFADQVGTGWLGRFMMLGLGIPLYVCATASVPMGLAMMTKGISAGAVLVFLMTGPATNAATIATVWKVLGRRSALVYLGVIAVSALLAGWALDGLMLQFPEAPMHAGHAMLPVWMRMASAVLLAGVLVYALPWPFRRRVPVPVLPGETGVRMEIAGMKCSQCAAGIQRVLREVPGVDAVEVTFQPPVARVLGKHLDAAALEQAVQRAGAYAVTGVISEIASGPGKGENSPL